MALLDTPILVNNFKANLTADISSGATSMALSNTTGITGASATSPIWLTIIDPATYLNNDNTQIPEILEVVKVTAVSGLSVTTMVRGQKGTTARAFSAGAVVVLRHQADVIGDLYTALVAGTKGINVLEATVRGDFAFAGSGFDKAWSEFISAGRMFGRLTGSTATGPTNITLGTNRTEVPVIDFADGSTLVASANFWLPSWYDGRAVKFRLHWTTAGGSAGNGVYWEYVVMSHRDGSNMALTTGSGTGNVTDTVINTPSYHHITDEVSIVPGNVAAGRNLIALQISRVPSNGADNMAATARLLGVECYF